MPYGWPFDPFAQNIPEIQRGEPESTVQGDTLHFFKQSPTFQLSSPIPGTWQLAYHLRGVTGSTIDFADNGTGSGGLFEVNIPSATTALWLPGDYEASGYVTLIATGERHQVYDATWKITPNLATLPPTQDTRSFAAQMRDTIQKALLVKAGHDILVSDVERTRIERIPPAELQSSWRYWDTIVKQEQEQARADAGFTTGRNILVRFNRITP